jgi:hypothetical protein
MPIPEPVDVARQLLLLPPYESSLLSKEKCMSEKVLPAPVMIMTEFLGCTQRSAQLEAIFADLYNSYCNT